jgi:hypothetical protein
VSNLQKGFDSEYLGPYLALFNLTYRAGKANGDADPLSRIQPETKLMFHDAIKAVCSVCAVSASNPCILLPILKMFSFL